MAGDAPINGMGKDFRTPYLSNGKSISDKISLPKSPIFIKE
jgi:hypothetical protein